MENYDKTPSFYNNEEVFNNFLKQTSYYKAIQECLLSIIKFTNPNHIVELGSATGSSSFLVAENFADKTIVGYDFRQNIVDEARRLNKFSNASFECMDMVEFAKTNITADLVFMLHSFHHIVDPLNNKVEFLSNLYKNMKKGSFVCILEAFIPEECKLNDKADIVKLWELRSNEGYASTFWNVIKDKQLTEENIEKAEQIAAFCKENEYQAGLLVAERDNEYLVHRSWLKTQAEEIGFKVLLDQSINSIGEGAVLFQI